MYMTMDDCMQLAVIESCIEDAKSLVRYDFGFHDLNLQKNLRVLRQLQYLHPFDTRH